MNYRFSDPEIYLSCVANIAFAWEDAQKVQPEIHLTEEGIAMHNSGTLLAADIEEQINIHTKEEK